MTVSHLPRSATLVACLLLGAVVPASAGAAPASVTGTPVPGAEWTVDTPESHGIDPARLDDAGDYALEAGRNTQGVVVVHEGAIVAEWYAAGIDQDSPAASWSMGKSFASALIGIALDEGLIPSIDEPMSTYYPAWVGTPREAITLRHVLHMESGLDWDEEYDPVTAETSDIIAMVTSQEDQLAFAASRPAEVAPGTRFNYSSGDSMLLSGVLEQATGMSAEAYAQEKLFGPLDIDPAQWWQDAEGHTLTYCCLDMASRDFARFGLLYLNDGTWGPDQVVPASWVDDSITDTANDYSDYGYQWWLELGGLGGLPPYYAALGVDGQYIYIVPSLDLVVVRNGLYYQSECPPIADPNLFEYYPPDGIIPGKGTIGPDTGWSDVEFLTPIVEAITGTAESDAATVPTPSTEPRGDAAVEDATAAACSNVGAPATTTTSPVPVATTEGPQPATPIAGSAEYTG